ncbi:MAG TPA: hypothetical protein VFR89_00975 [candidate division Zixibacteria bacterium]|nr:hypothetical protein [candidate division Zixibacteria bacterium]
MIDTGSCQFTEAIELIEYLIMKGRSIAKIIIEIMLNTFPFCFLLLTCIKEKMPSETESIGRPMPRTAVRVEGNFAGEGGSIMSTSNPA